MSETKVEYKTCRVTIVTPGYSDQVLDIHPAQHEKETVWMNKVEGQQRWEEIQRTLSAGTPHNKPVVKAKPWHEPGNRLMQPDLKEADIPKAELEMDVVLKAPKVEEKVKNNWNTPLKQQERNVEIMTKANDALLAKSEEQSEQISILMEKLAEKELAEAGDSRVSCSVCSKDFAREETLRQHMEKFHK